MIAIENSRLFNALQEKNRALTEVHGSGHGGARAADLRPARSCASISSSPTDERPVFAAIDAIARAAFCEACFFGYRFPREGRPAPRPWPRPTVGGRRAGIAAVHERSYPSSGCTWGDTPRPGARSLIERSFTCEDSWTDPESKYRAPPRGTSSGLRSILTVPDVPRGRGRGSRSPVCGGPEPRPFTDKQIDLLKTFADQAVIALENVRLFTELVVAQRRVDRCTRTADGHRRGVACVISRAQTHDAQPVFDTRRRAPCGCAGRLASYSGVVLYDGEAAPTSPLLHNVNPEGAR